MKTPIWKTPKGEIISCVEKIKVMQQNIDEIQSLVQDAFDDGVLMGIDPIQLRDFFIQLMSNIENKYDVGRTINV